jgi:hypothetical protein
VVGVLGQEDGHPLPLFAGLVVRPTSLVVKDEALALLLGGEGDEVILAANGEVALNYLYARGKPDFILLDLLRSQALLEEVRRCLG